MTPFSKRLREYLVSAIYCFGKLMGYFMNKVVKASCSRLSIS